MARAITERSVGSQRTHRHPPATHRIFISLAIYQQPSTIPKRPADCHGRCGHRRGVGASRTKAAAANGHHRYRVYPCARPGVGDADTEPSLMAIRSRRRWRCRLPVLSIIKGHGAWRGAPVRDHPRHACVGEDCGRGTRCLADDDGFSFADVAMDI